MVLVRIEDKLMLWVFIEGPKPEIGENVILAIRPEIIIISNHKGNQLNVFKSDILSRQFNGYATEYKINVQGVNLNAITLSEEGKIFDTDNNVYVEIPARKINLLSETSNSMV